MDVQAVLGEQDAGGVEDTLSVATGIGALLDLDGRGGWSGCCLRGHVDLVCRDSSSL
jgi:hypothetical protein